MTEQVAAPLTSDEFTVLDIASKGQYLAPIGRWKKSILGLTQRGLMQRLDDVNYTITAAGMEAHAAEDAEREKRTDAVLHQAVERLAKIQTTQERIIPFAEQAAQLLADAAMASHRAKGDSPEFAAREWSRVILEKALKILEGRK